VELETMKLEVADHIATVTIDRPPVNAQNGQFRREILALFDELSVRDDVRVVILTGEGSIFSAGADIKERGSLVASPGEYLGHNRITRESFFAMTDCSKPVIAAINGACIGAGYALAASCDILIASEDAWVQMPELDRGLAGGAKFLSMHFTRSRSRLLFFTGRKISAAEMYRIGAIDEVTAPDELMPMARQIAQEIAEKSPLAIKKAKLSFNVAESMPHLEGYRYEQTVTLELADSSDATEARQAFLEKRAPVFTGK